MLHNEEGLDAKGRSRNCANVVADWQEITLK